MAANRPNASTMGKDMLKRITFLTAASLLLLTSGAGAEGVIAGTATEVRKLDRKLIGPAYYLTTTDGRTFKLAPKSASALVAMQLIAPEAIVALPEADVVAVRRGAPAAGAPVIAAAVPRGVEPVPVVVIERGRALDAGTTTNLYPAQAVAVADVQPGSAIAVPGGEPVVKEEGYYVRGTESDTVAMTTIRLSNGQMVTIADRVQLPHVIEGDVEFDPAALEPGKYVRIVRREDGTYFLGTASAPREKYLGSPAGKVSAVDSRAQVIQLNDGGLYHPVHRASAVLVVGDQPIEPAAIRPGTWVVIDSPALTVDSPAAIPADTIIRGQLFEVTPRTGAR